jgi:Ni/Co efflux regulator RcnB
MLALSISYWDTQNMSRLFLSILLVFAMAGASAQSAQDEVKPGETDAPKDYQEEADKPKDYNEESDAPKDHKAQADDPDDHDDTADKPKDYDEKAAKPVDYDEAADKPRDYDEDAVEGVIEEPCVVEPCPQEKKKKKKKKDPPSIQPVPSSN